MSRHGAAVIGCHWRDGAGELRDVTRSIAGAATRSGPVTVLVPGLEGATADGAFDLESIGEQGSLGWPEDLSPGAVVVDDLTPELASLLEWSDPAPVYYLSATAAELSPAWQRLHLVGQDGPVVHVHVPVNPLARRHRHHGFGFTGYVLVLSDRTGPADDPPPPVAWLSAAFMDADVVVVEDAVASAWKGRALRGRVAVDTRMDLWRLLAHASMCVDLAPGPHIARECIEALRFGTPIVVPKDSGAGAVHARAGGGATFSDEHELLQAAAALSDGRHRAEVSASAQRYADRLYGDPAAFVRRVKELLTKRQGHP